jgi:hypothetical protein
VTRRAQQSRIHIQFISYLAYGVIGLRYQTQPCSGVVPLHGRKRHLMGDVTGMVLAVVVHQASIQEKSGAKLLLARAAQKGFDRLALIWADGGYSGQPMIDWVFQLAGGVFQVVLHVHGVGPKAVGLLCQALAAKGLSFAE